MDWVFHRAASCVRARRLSRAIHGVLSCEHASRVLRGVLFCERARARFAECCFANALARASRSFHRAARPAEDTEARSPRTPRPLRARSLPAQHLVRWRTGGRGIMGYPPSQFPEVRMGTLWRGTPP